MDRTGPVGPKNIPDHDGWRHSYNLYIIFCGPASSAFVFEALRRRDSKPPYSKVYCILQGDPIPPAANPALEANSAAVSCLITL